MPEETTIAPCIEALSEAGARASAQEPVETEPGCRINDPVRLETVRSGDGTVVLNGGPVLDCRFALSLARWLGDVVSPLARHHLGAAVDRLQVGPGYVCRGRNGAATGKLSEHAFGNAIDILGMTLADGKDVMIADLPTATGGRRRFLEAIRTSACGYFTTVLGPGADDAHTDHYHVDLGQHGNSDRYRICQ